MAKRKKRAKKKGGPYLAAAFFCDAILEEKSDSAMSAIRIFDTVTLTIDPSTPPEVPSEEHRLPVRVTGLLSFKAGDSRGTHALRLVMHSPSGEKSETVLEQTLPFTPEPQGGTNMRLASVIQIKKGGLFWIDVILDDKLLTRMPLQITIRRAEQPSNQPPGAK